MYLMATSFIIHIVPLCRLTLCCCYMVGREEKYHHTIEHLVSFCSVWAWLVSWAWKGVGQDNNKAEAIDTDHRCRLQPQISYCHRLVVNKAHTPAITTVSSTRPQTSCTHNTVHTRQKILPSDGHGTGTVFSEL